MTGLLVGAAELEAARQKELKTLRSRMQAEKERIQREISSYPTPIAGCDQQFNYLLERRTLIRREWARLLQAEQENARRCHSAENN